MCVTEVLMIVLLCLNKHLMFIRQQHRQISVILTK